MAAEQQQQQSVSVKAAGGGGSRFAVTCGLLRQYMKEQGGNGVRLAPPMATMSLMPPGADVAAPAEDDRPEEGKKATVLELFPQQPGTLKKASSSQERREPGERIKAPLTIFYGGRMVVFDDFPAEKAEELMKVAGGSGNAASPPAAAAGQPLLPDMPIARKASLQRFLAKRKNRIATGSPDPAPATESASKRVKDLDGAPCLGGVNPMLTLN